MALLVNGAGASAADPILKGLGIRLIFGASSMDIASITNAWIDQAAGFPGTNSVSGSLSPATSVLTAGATGTYTQATQQYNIGNTTGLAAGDFIYLSHAALTDGIYEIASVVDAANVTIVNNPLGADQSSIAFQVCWMYDTDTGTSPIVSSAGGTQNFWKAEASDGTNSSQSQDSFYVRDAPSGADYIELESGDYTGQTVADNVLTLDILRLWANAGGISHVALANHSVQTVNNFTWTTLGGTGEQTLAAAETNGLTASAGDGIKYGRLIFKSESGGFELGVDIDITIDSAGPTLTLSAQGS